MYQQTTECNAMHGVKVLTVIMAYVDGLYRSTLTLRV